MHATFYTHEYESDFVRLGFKTFDNIKAMSTTDCILLMSKNLNYFITP